jgi:hypothetical protein
MRHIVTLSGGVASAYVADMVLRDHPDAIFYFNDVKWEHEDLYRFLSDLENYWQKKITYDNDGRDPEQVFYDQNFLGNNRVPLCSRVLKAERLQKYVTQGDVVYFGIDASEAHRSIKIRKIYQKLGVITRFPLIDNQIFKPQMFTWLERISIEIPELYKLGFTHNNCHGGCVRAGKRQWVHLLKVFPNVYAERERLEEEFSLISGKQLHFLKDQSLKELRKQYEESLKYGQDLFDDLDGSDDVTECIGICNTMN